MNVSLPFASPARKQDTPNNNKQGQPHDKWCPSETTTSHEDYRSVKTGNMDRDPQKNLPPVSNNYGSQYNWLSPLRDVQHDTFNPTPASYPEDDPIPSIDPELSIERVPITSSRENTFSNSGINKVAMVKNAFIPMSLYSLLCVNEIIRYHLHIVDRSTMCK